MKINHTIIFNVPFNNKSKLLLLKLSAMNITFIKKYFTLLVVLFISIQTVAQNFIPFTPRFEQDLRGDMILIGNNILGPDNNPFNNENGYNQCMTQCINKCYFLRVVSRSCSLTDAF